MNTPTLFHFNCTCRVLSFEFKFWLLLVLSYILVYLQNDVRAALVTRVKCPCVRVCVRACDVRDSMIIDDQFEPQANDVSSIALYTAHQSPRII